jgi:hypothetical protein
MGGGVRGECGTQVVRGHLNGLEVRNGVGGARGFGAGRFATHGCDIFLEFRGQKLSRYLAQYEITEMMRQYGALPPRGDLIGGSYLLSLMHHDL